MNSDRTDRHFHSGVLSRTEMSNQGFLRFHFDVDLVSMGVFHPVLRIVATCVKYPTLSYST